MDNTDGDARITNDTGHLYIWDGNIWQDQGDILDLNWSAINNKPSSVVGDIDDAVTKKHIQNTDEYLSTQVTKTLYVDKNRTDSYTENGSITKPYKTINNLLTVGIPTGAVVKIALGYYTEDVDLTGLLDVTIIGDNTRSGDGVRIQGTVIISGINTKVNLKGIRVQPITDKIALDYVDGDNCYFQDCVFRNKTAGAVNPIIRIGDVASGGGLGTNVPRFYNCNVFKEGTGIVIQGANLAIINFKGGFIDADITMIGAYGILLDNISGSSAITHNVGVLGIYRSQIGGLTSAITATPATAFIALNQVTLRANDGITVGSIILNGTCPYVIGICDYNIAGSNFGAGTKIYNSFDRDLKNTSSVIGDTVKDALETLDINKTTLPEVKADVDIADAISKKHTQGTDTQLDSGVVAVGAGDDVTLTQNLVIPFTSVNPGAVANTFYLKEGKVGIGTTSLNRKLTVRVNTDDGIDISAINSSNLRFMTDILGDARNWMFSNQHSLTGFELLRSSVAGGDPNIPVLAFDQNGNAGIGLIDPDAKLEVNGYTKLGSNAPKIKMKKLTGTTGTGSTTIAHGLTASKILDMSILVQELSGAFVHPVYTPNTSDISYYQTYFGTDNIILELQGANINSRPYTILITYEE